MRLPIQVHVLRSEPTPQIPDTWPLLSLRALLTTVMEDDDGTWTDAEVPEMLTMALQDLPPDEAAEAVLTHLTAPRVRPGIRAHMVQELKAGRAWERHSEIENHLPLFEAALVLHTAHPRAFTAPVAHQLTLALTPSSDAGRALLSGEVPAAVLCRLIAAGAPQGLLYRLFDTALDGDRFPEAAHVVWRATIPVPTDEAETSTQGPVRMDIFGSNQWFGPIETGSVWTAPTWPDRA